jgi:hypothetical protein
MKIKYDGKYPNLCSGILKVYAAGTDYIFEAHSLCSNGQVWFDNDWDEHVEEGNWSISKYPENFPEKYKGELIQLINEEIPHGCCGGCV